MLARCVDLTINKKPSYKIVPYINHNEKIIVPEAYSIDVAQHYMTCLKFYHQKIDEQLNTLHASMQLDDEQCKLVIVPCEGNEFVKDWQSRCKDAVDTFIRNLIVEILNISVEKRDIMQSIVNTTIEKEKALHIEYEEGSVTIAGEQNDVSRVKKFLDETCQAIVSETVQINNEKFFLLLTAKLKYKSCDNPLEVQVSVNSDDRSVTVIGFEEKCEEFKSDLFKQMDQMQCVPVLLNNLFAQFLCTETGKTLLQYYLQRFRAEVVTYLDDAGKLFILGTAESQVAIITLIQTIQSRLHCFRIVCPPSTQKILQGKEWLDFCAEFESKQFVQIKIVKHCIKIIGDVGLSNPVRIQIDRFIDNESQTMKHFQLCNAQWRVIQMYMDKKWKKLNHKLHKERQIQLVVPDSHDEDPVIIIEGERSKVESVGEKIKDFLSLIVSSEPIRLIQHGIVEYFFSEKGRTAVEYIEANEQSCIHLSIEDDLSTLSDGPMNVSKANSYISNIQGVGASSPTYGKQKALLLQVFAVDIEKVRKTDTCLQHLIDNHIFIDKMDDRIISQITPQQCNTIEQMARTKNVNVTIEPGKLQHYIQLEGDLSDVITLKHEIHSILHERNITESMLRNVKCTQAKVKWQWQNKSGTYEDYDALANYDIEQAYQSDQSALFDMHNSPEQLNFQKMEAKNKKNEEIVYQIRRLKVKFGRFILKYVCIPYT